MPIEMMTTGFGACARPPLATGRDLEMRAIRHSVLTFVALVVGLVLAASPAAAAAADSYSTPDDGIVVGGGSSGAGGTTHAPGGTLTVEVTNLLPGSTAEVYVHSDPVHLGTLTADSTGTARGSFTLPADLAAGDHTVRVTGTDSSGNPRTWSYAITVAAAADGGGVPDELSFTGSNTLALVGAGALLVGAGVVTVRFRQRRLGVTA